MIATIATPRAATTGEDVIARLDTRLQQIVERIEASEFWANLTAADADPALVRDIMREIYLEIVGYQPHTVEAAFNIVGRMPKTEDKLMKSMILHYIDETPHAFMALRDYGALGGDPAEASSRRISPASFAVASVWRTMATIESPFTYLGMLYIFEALTPIVTGKVLARFAEIGFPKDALEFIEFHATEDIKHANLIRHLIKRAIAKFPAEADAIVYGFDCFAQVYPLPVWETAMKRAMQSRGVDAAAPPASAEGSWCYR